MSASPLGRGYHIGTAPAPPAQSRMIISLPRRWMASFWCSLILSSSTISDGITTERLLLPVFVTLRMYFSIPPFYPALLLTLLLTLLRSNIIPRYQLLRT